MLKVKNPQVQPQTLILRARELQQEISRLKDLEEELDLITNVLRDIKGIDAYGAVIRDRFTNKNTRRKAAQSPINRFQLILSPTPSQTRADLRERLDAILVRLENRLSKVIIEKEETFHVKQ